MMSAQLVASRRRSTALGYPAIGAETPERCRLRGGLPRADCRDPKLGLACLASGKDGAPAFDGSSLCRANIARGLRSHVASQRTLDDQTTRSPPRFGLRPTSLTGLPDACGPRPVLFVITASMVAVVSSGRFGWLAHVVLDLACLTEG